jgi:hypothetical protein
VALYGALYRVKYGAAVAEIQLEGLQGRPFGLYLSEYIADWHA